MATVNEKLNSESVAHALFVSRYSTGAAKKMVKILDESDKKLSAALLMALEDLDPDSFTVKRLESLLGDVRKINDAATKGMLDGLLAEINGFAEYESGYQLDLFNTIIPKDILSHIPLMGISYEQVYAAAIAQPFQGRLLKEWASNMGSDRIRRITNAVRSGYLGGDTVDTIVRRIRGTKAADYTDGVLQIGRANAASIIKTAISHTAAIARNKFAQNNSDLITAKQWSSTIDTKTSAQCRIRDRLRYTLDNKPIGHKIPYLSGPGKIHFCCRSGETFITASWQDLGIKKDELSAATRASMDGQIPAQMSYGEWLQKQSTYRQTKVLGPTRYKLVRDGGMNYDSFYSDKGEWLTLAQLRDIDAKAFEEAGL